MKKYDDNSQESCPLKYMLSVFGGKWKQPIICMLATGVPLRNSTIKRRLGKITDMMLAQSLRELEADGIINRQQFNEIPPHVEYSLTEKGRTVVPILQMAAQWAVQNNADNGICGSHCQTCQHTS